ncbi:MAG: desulfoferrodoxin [Candidatus Dojkabacteria bacterium]
MTELNQIYKCEICGNIVEVVHTGAGTLVCCNQPMVLMKEFTEDEGFEKHVPSLAFENSKLIVTIGDVEHPMEKEHYIEWIEYIADNEVQRVYLTPEDRPTATFNFKENRKYTVRTYCNIHGLWELRM